VKRKAKKKAVPNEEFWTTIDGTRIAVGDMTPGHVRNVLRMILRQRRRRNFRDQVIAAMTQPSGYEEWLEKAD
jgi:hypothetical protein